MKLSQLYTVFENPHYPQCCTVAMDPSQVCLYRIPVVLSIPESPVVLAFAEARLGKVSEIHWSHVHRMQPMTDVDSSLYDRFNYS